MAVFASRRRGSDRSQRSGSMLHPSPGRTLQAESSCGVPTAVARHLDGVTSRAVATARTRRHGFAPMRDSSREQAS